MKYRESVCKNWRQKQEGRGENIEIEKWFETFFIHDQTISEIWWKPLKLYLINIFFLFYTN